MINRSKRMRAADKVAAMLVSVGIVSMIATERLGDVQAFSTTHRGPSTVSRRNTRLWYTNEVTQQKPSQQDIPLPEISDMKASEMKAELESYGVSTRSMFDKADFEKALEYARLEGMTSTVEDVADKFTVGGENTKAVKEDWTTMSNAESTATSATSSENKEKRVWGRRGFKNTHDTSSEATTATDSTSTNGAKKSSFSATDTRQELYDRAVDVAKKMKLSELKQELRDRGVEVKAFFEKSEFVKAYANAIADNLPKKKKTDTSTNDVKKGSKSNYRAEDVYDPDYRDVRTQIIVPGTIALDNVIDITDLFHKYN